MEAMFLNWADCTEGGECLRRSPGWTGGQATVAQTGMAGRREGEGWRWAVEAEMVG